VRAKSQVRAAFEAFSQGCRYNHEAEMSSAQSAEPSLDRLMKSAWRLRDLSKSAQCIFCLFPCQRLELWQRISAVPRWLSSRGREATCLVSTRTAILACLGNAKCISRRDSCPAALPILPSVLHVAVSLMLPLSIRGPVALF
jgi:hypothetical protein